MVLLRLQHLFRSREVFLSAIVLHSLTGTQAGEHRWHQPGPLPMGWAQAVPLQHQPRFLRHRDTAGHTKWALGTQSWQIPCCSELYWKLHTLQDPQPSATEHIPLYWDWRLFLEWFTVKSIQSTLLGQLYFAFPIAGLNDTLLIPNCVSWGVLIYFCFSSRDPQKETQTLAWFGEGKVMFDLPIPNHISYLQKG